MVKLMELLTEHQERLMEKLRFLPVEPLRHPPKQRRQRVLCERNRREEARPKLSSHLDERFGPSFDTILSRYHDRA